MDKSIWLFGCWVQAGGFYLTLAHLWQERALDKPARAGGRRIRKSISGNTQRRNSQLLNKRKFDKVLEWFRWVHHIMEGRCLSDIQHIFVLFANCICLLCKLYLSRHFKETNDCRTRWSSWWHRPGAGTPTRPPYWWSEDGGKNLIVFYVRRVAILSKNSWEIQIYAFLAFAR